MFVTAPVAVKGGMFGLLPLMARLSVPRLAGRLTALLGTGGCQCDCGEELRGLAFFPSTSQGHHMCTLGILM